MTHSKDVFKVGNLSIGYIWGDFTERFGDATFEKRTLGSFHKLTKTMTANAMIDEGLAKECELGDVYAFLQSPPEEAKDGYYNLFYISSCVVSVRWSVSRWGVWTWARGSGWLAGARVFSPATDPKPLVPRTSDTQDPLALRTCIATEEIAKQLIYMGGLMNRIAVSLESKKKVIKRKKR